jgi:hypothetical protein
MKNSLLHRFVVARNGTTIVEFALVAVFFFTLLLGIVEIGLIQFHRIALESITASAAREASIGKTSDPDVPCAQNDRVAYVSCYVREKSRGLIHSERIEIRATPVCPTCPGNFPRPDICLTDPPSITIAVCPPGTPYENANGIPGYQNTTMTKEYGDPGALTRIEVIYPWKVQFPFLGQYFGHKSNGEYNGIMTIRTAIIVKNESFN